ncbi:MAG: dihydrofolate reductase [Pseudomonadota bacterium]|nr:dihydrofolate reductase [Pseudomonadota bacterium]
MHDTPPPAASPSAPEPSRVPRIALIAAVARNGIIGIKNRLPWRLPEDMRRFRALTTGHAVIMGRHTWESIGKPLSERQNIVVTHRMLRSTPDVEFATSLEDALARVRLPDPAFVIGGEALYREALSHADLLYLTEIDRDFAGDARFPEFDRARWRETARDARTALDEPDAFTYYFVVYEKTDR